MDDIQREKLEKIVFEKSLGQLISIDDLINLLMEELLKFMKLNKKNLEDGTHLLFIAKNIERIGDHATNIAEHIYFLIKGTQIKGQRPKGQDSIVSDK